ncbi:hypothetical protein AXW83_01930 [Bosea sp. PAMC 26642]|nr:hypothetical protein AXW83_01930 [Bosea sp. PAMC 26642]
MAQSVGGVGFIGGLALLARVRRFHGNQFTDGAGEHCKRLGVGLARDGARRQIVKTRLVRIEMPFGRPPQGVDHGLAADGQTFGFRSRQHRGVVFVIGHVETSTARHAKAAG